MPQPRTLSKLVGDLPAAPCRAWVNFNGTGTVAIRASFNVSSVTDNGAGDYSVNFATALSSANFAVSIVAGFSSASPTFGAESATTRTYTASSVRFVLNRVDGVAVDREIVNVIIFGN